MYKAQLLHFFGILIEQNPHLYDKLSKVVRLIQLLQYFPVIYLRQTVFDKILLLFYSDGERIYLFWIITVNILEQYADPIGLIIEPFDLHSKILFKELNVEYQIFTV